METALELVALITFPPDNLDFRILRTVVKYSVWIFPFLLHALFHLLPIPPDTCRFLLPLELLVLEKSADLFRPSDKISLFSWLKVHILICQTPFQYRHWVFSQSEQAGRIQIFFSIKFNAVHVQKVTDDSTLSKLRLVLTILTEESGQ